MKRLVSLLLAVLIIATLGACTPSEDTDEPKGRVVTDLVGREVEVPDDAQQIAAMTGPSYEMVFMLDEADRINMVKAGHTTNYPLALLTNPDLANFNTVAANPSSNVNIEDYLAENIDLVIYYETDSELKKFENAGIPAVVVTVNTGILDTLEAVKAQTIDEYIENVTSPVMILAETLGTDKAMAEAKAWKSYSEGIIRKVYDRTKNLEEADRKTVYWGNTWGENVLTSYSTNNRWYEVMLAGGNLVGPDVGGGNFPEITSEQLFKWDPEVILVDNHGNHPELVIKSMTKEGSKWETLSAVENNQLHRIPAGVFFLDKGTTTPLLTLWMATVIQPELFSDIDMAKEVQYYYKEFYEYDLSLEDAQKVIDGWWEGETFGKQ